MGVNTVFFFFHRGRLKCVLQSATRRRKLRWIPTRIRSQKIIVRFLFYLHYIIPGPACLYTLDPYVFFFFGTTLKRRIIGLT